MNRYEYENALRGALGQGILTGAIRVGGMPEGTAETIAKWQGESRAITTLALTPEAAPEPADPTDAQLKEFFEADKEPFREPERRWGRFIRISPADLVKDIKPSDEEVKTEYEARIDDFTTAPKRTVEQIIFDDKIKADEAAKRIADGTSSFAEIAAEQNISVENLSLGEVGEGELAEIVDKAIFALDKPGIAGPIQVLDGFALLNVTAVTQGGVQKFEDVKDEVAGALAMRFATGLATKRAGEIEELRAGGASLEDIAKQLGVTLSSFTGLAADGTVSEGDAPLMIADPAFMAEVQQANAGDERSVIDLATGGHAVVIVDRIAEAHLPELSTITDKVAAAWKAEERLKALEARAKDLIEKAGAEGIAAIGTELDDTPVELPAAVRTQLPPMIGADLRAKIFEAKKDDLLFGRTRGDQSILIVQVRDVTPMEGDALAERVEAVKTAMATSIGADTQELFARALEMRHGATFNQSAIDGVFERLGQTGY